MLNLNIDSIHSKETVSEFIDRHQLKQNIKIEHIYSMYFDILSKNISGKQILISMYTSEYTAKMLNSSAHNFNIILITFALNVPFINSDDIKLFIKKKQFNVLIRKKVYQDLYFQILNFLYKNNMQYILPNIGKVLDYYYTYKQ